MAQRWATRWQKQQQVATDCNRPELLRVVVLSVIPWPLCWAWLYRGKQMEQTHRAIARGSGKPHDGTQGAHLQLHFCVIPPLPIPSCFN